MPRPFLIVSQLDYLIMIVDIYEWQTVQIQISWLLQKPADLDLHCLQRQGISGLSRTMVNVKINLMNKYILKIHFVSYLLQCFYFIIKCINLTLKLPSHNNCHLLFYLLVILSKQCGPRSDSSSWCSLIRVHTVCLCAKIGLKSLQEYSGTFGFQYTQQSTCLTRVTIPKDTHEHFWKL